MSTDEANESKRSGLRPWGKGQSGNPHGRRAKGLATAERLRNALVKDMPEILEAVVKAAKGGDLGAARTVLERVLPPLKAIEAPIAPVTLEGGLTEQGTAVLAAMASGRLTPDQAVKLLGALGAQAKIVEVDELTRRIAALESKLGVTK